MRFRMIGSKTPGHPVLWLFAFLFFAAGAAYTAYDCTRDYVAGPNGTAIQRTSWGGLIIWSGIALYFAFQAIPVVGVCLRMLSRSGNVHGICPGCGYDLRATPDRCPECGRVS